MYGQIYEYKNGEIQEVFCSYKNAKNAKTVNEPRSSTSKNASQTDTSFKAFKSKGASETVIEKNLISGATNNFKNSTKTMRFVKGTTLVGSAMLVFSGAKNLIAPERDESGERKNSAWAEVAKIGAAAALTYFAVLRNKGTGLAR